MYRPCDDDRDGVHRRTSGRTLGRNPATVAKIHVGSREKEWTGRINWKEGCTIAHVVKAAMEFGCCPESVAPYDFKASSLTTQAFREALKIKALNQVEIPDYESAKRFLDGGYGAIVAGVNWTSSMSSCPGVMTENMVRSGRSVGGHAVPFVGFRRNGNLLLPNSWGSSYANNGVAEVTPDAFTGFARRLTRSCVASRT